MIRQVIDKSRYNIPVFSDPRLHEVAWYATEDDAVLGVVILDPGRLGYLLDRANAKRSAPRLHSDGYGIFAAYRGRCDRCTARCHEVEWPATGLNECAPGLRTCGSGRRASLPQPHSRL